MKWENTHTYTHTVWECVWREKFQQYFRMNGCKWQVCILYIYTHSAPPSTFCTEICLVLVPRPAMCVDLMESGFFWQCDRLLITCDQNSTQRRALLFLSFPGWEWVICWNSFSLHLFWFLCHCVILHPYWRTSHLELWNQCIVLVGEVVWTKSVE